MNTTTTNDNITINESAESTMKTTVTKETKTYIFFTVEYTNKRTGETYETKHQMAKDFRIR